MAGPSTRKMGIFYNGAMEMDRNITVIILKVLRTCGLLGRDDFVALDGMGATGIRGLRIAREVGRCSVVINDINPQCVELASRNAEENDLSSKVELVKGDVRATLAGRWFDYVDIDPFGTPAPFVESTIRSVRNGGIFAITATDTATLFGSYPMTCLRRYDSMPLKSYLSHEMGVRILAGFVVRRASMVDRAALPVFAYANDHYYRVFFMLRKGAKLADELLGEIRYALYDPTVPEWSFSDRRRVHVPRKNCVTAAADHGLAGPLYTGKLIHPEVARVLRGADLASMAEGFGRRERCEKLLSILAGEAGTLPFFYCTHEMARMLGSGPPPMASLMERLRGEGIETHRTHFSPTGIKIDEKHAGRESEMARLIRKAASGPC